MKKSLLTSDTRRVNAIVASGTIITALGVSIAIVSLHQPGNSNTAKSLVEAYHARKAGREPLIFLKAQPYSASFYSLRCTIVRISDQFQFVQK